MQSCPTTNKRLYGRWAEREREREREKEREREINRQTSLLLLLSDCVMSQSLLILRPSAATA